MAKHNAQNTRIKRDYFEYLKHAQRRDEASIDQVARALAQFEQSTGHKDFKKFHIKQAVAFKTKLSEQKNAKTGKPLSRATVHSTLSALRAFFVWLADKPGYKSRIGYSDADYFNLSDKEVRVAKARREKPVPTIEQVHRVLATMPAASDIERRNKALIALALLTGARAAALASLKLKHIDLEDGCIDQDAREVDTKFSKSFKTWFCPVGGDALQIVTDWVEFLREQMLWGEDDPLFPKTLIGVGERGGFQAMGLAREHWSNTDAIRKIYKEAFTAADLPYYSPHCFRHALALLGERICPTIESFKAWSQNIGHEKMLTTLTSYGTVPVAKQAELIRGLEPGKTETEEERIAAIVAATMRQMRRER